MFKHLVFSMFLKRLELNGFKSFANGIALEFAQGLTAIVGPNGSGKSNVVDAIRWALGEQSMKRVRSSEGADLIFSGSNKASRKGKATVKMVFDNSDGVLPLEVAEAEVERSVSRDGVGSFRINRESVRLTDIVELLAHGNIGHRSTAVINQGMEAEILRAGPVELRDILEESSGVKPLQLKRQRSERRLRATLRNRKEAQTMLREMRPHLRFLEGQMQRVTSLRQLEEKYDDLAQSLSRYRVDVLAKDLEAFDRTISDVERRLEAKDKELRILEAEQKKEEGERESPVSQFEKKRHELEDLRRDLERRQAVLEARAEVEHEIGRSKPDGGRSVVEYSNFLKLSVDRLRDIIASDDLSSRRSVLEELFAEMTEFLSGESVKIDGVQDQRVNDNDSAREISSLAEKVKEISKEITVMRVEERDAIEEWRGSFLERTKILRALEGEVRDLREERRNISWNRGRQQELDASLEDIVGSVSESNSCGVTIVNEKEARKAMDELRLLREKKSALEEGDEQVVDEYEEVNGRVQFFDDQIKDLDKTVKSLEKVVDELDKKMKTQFGERLEVINERFHHFFRMLFGGGKASLRTVQMKSDEEEEGGVSVVMGLEVHAQLPGKRIDDLTSFSGGERALTSIALLFAIISANPPPFLVLDEVDATLDESNAQRFCKILRDFGDATQFILITHNRETMREADLLYGVTMGGDGISQVLSLKLEKAQEYAVE